MKQNLKALGPGLLYAGAAVGVSHLIQSTRAGANFGFSMIWIVLIANFLKYPFFEVGHRYAFAHKKSLLDGYHKLGKTPTLAFFILSFVSMFIIQAAITAVTAQLIVSFFNLTLPVSLIAFLLLSLSSGILIVGKYQLLDSSIKVIMVLLSTSVTIAVSMALSHADFSKQFAEFTMNNGAHLTFLLAFIGWMPAPIDISIWQSNWVAQKLTSTSSLSSTLFDFRFGYWGTAFLAIIFLLLGALILQQPEGLSPKPVAFTNQLLGGFTSMFGTIGGIIVGIAAITTMLSTTITVLDGYSQSVGKAFSLLLGHTTFSVKTGIVWIIVLVTGSLVILSYFGANMILLVDLATVLSFLSAPFFGILNLIVNKRFIPKQYQISQLSFWIGILGTISLVLFSGYYLYFKLMS